MEKTRKFTVKKILLATVVVILLTALRQLQYDDSIFHITRIVQMTENLKDGWLYPFPSYFGAIGGAGYPLPLFYGDLFLLPAAFIYAATNSIRAAVSINDIFIYSSILISSYYVFKGIGMKNAFSFSVMYLTAVSVGFMSAMNGNIALCLSAIFIPLVFYFYYRIVYLKEHLIVALAFSMTGLFLAHVISTYLVILLLFGHFIYRLVLKKMSVPIFIDLMKSALLCMGLTAYFWFPMLEQNFYYDTKVSTAGLSGSLLPYDYSESVKSLPEFLIVNEFLYGNVVNIFFATSLILWGLNLRNRPAKKYDRLFILILAMNVIQFIPIFAKIMEPFLGVIQNVRRFDIIISFLEIVYIGLMLDITNIKNMSARNILIVHLLMIGTFTAWNYKELSAGSLYNSNKNRLLELTNTDDIKELDSKKFRKYNSSIQIGMGEYLPENFDATYFIKLDTSAREVYQYKRNGSNAVFNAKGKENIELPIVYQYGYHAEQNGEEIKLQESSHGLIEVVPKKEGKVSIAYTRTKIQIASIVVSLSVLLEIGYSLIRRYYLGKTMNIMIRDVDTRFRPKEK